MIYKVTFHLSTLYIYIYIYIYIFIYIIYIYIYQISSTQQLPQETRKIDTFYIQETSYTPTGKKILHNGEYQ